MQHSTLSSCAVRGSLSRVCKRSVSASPETLPRGGALSRPNAVPEMRAAVLADDAERSDRPHACGRGRVTAATIIERSQPLDGFL